jgi:hypothetical protein
MRASAQAMPTLFGVVRGDRVWGVRAIDVWSAIARRNAIALVGWVELVKPNIPYLLANLPFCWVSLRSTQPT